MHVRVWNFGNLGSVSVQENPSMLQKLFAMMIALAAFVTVVFTQNTCNAQMQFFISPGQVGAGESQAAKDAGIYRYFIGDALVVGPAEARIWNLGNGYVYGWTPVDGTWAAVSFDPLTGAVGHLGSAKIWTKEGEFTTWTAPTSYWWAFAGTQEGVKTIKPPKNVLQSLSGRAISNKLLKEKLEDLREDITKLEKEWEAAEAKEKKPEEKKAEKPEAPKPEAPKEEPKKEDTPPAPKAE